MFVHVRILRPLLGMNLLFMSLPLVLGGYGRNTFINLGFALGNSAMFYGGIIFCQYLGGFKIVTAGAGGLDSADRVRDDRRAPVGQHPHLSIEGDAGSASGHVPATVPAPKVTANVESDVGEGGLSDAKQQRRRHEQAGDDDAERQAVAGAGQLPHHAFEALQIEDEPAAHRA